MQPRTKRQREVLDYIVQFVDRNGHEPSYQQIARQLGLSARSGIQRHVAALETQGLITRKRSNGSFGLDLRTREAVPESMCAIPLIEIAVENERFVVSGSSIQTVPKFMIGSLSSVEAFAVTIPDESLIDLHICEEDLLLFERRSYARRGQVVAAVVGDGEFVIGQYHQKGQETEIRPANQEFEPRLFPADEITIEGVMLGLLRPPAIVQDA